jgi:hypothetical protein
VHEQVCALLGHVRRAGESLTAQDRLHLAQATALLLETSRVEQGLPGEITVVRSVTCIEDALQMLQDERDEAEEV